MIKKRRGRPALGAQSSPVGREVVLWLQSRRAVPSELLSKGGRPRSNPPPRCAGQGNTALQRAVRAVREGGGSAHLLYGGQRVLREASERVTASSPIAHVQGFGV